MSVELSLSEVEESIYYKRDRSLVSGLFWYSSCKVWSNWWVKLPTTITPLTPKSPTPPSSPFWKREFVWSKTKCGKKKRALKILKFIFQIVQYFIGKIVKIIYANYEKEFARKHFINIYSSVKVHLFITPPFLSVHTFLDYYPTHTFFVAFRYHRKTVTTATLSWILCCDVSDLEEVRQRALALKWLPMRLPYCFVFILFSIFIWHKTLVAHHEALSIFVFLVIPN